MSYFSEPYTGSKNKLKFALDLPNYATTSDLKNVAGVDTSNFAKMFDLPSLKSDLN